MPVGGGCTGPESTTTKATMVAWSVTPKACREGQRAKNRDPYPILQMESRDFGSRVGDRSKA